MADEWPADHNIGVFLAVGDHSRLVGTARGRGDLSRLLRHIADQWDRMQDDDAVDRFYPEIIPFGASRPGVGS